MKLHCMGRFSGDEASLPQGEHLPGAVMFKEPKDMRALARQSTLWSVVLLAAGLVLAVLRGAGGFLSWKTAAAGAASLLTLLPHELLHALCFQKDVYLYSDLRQGMLFVTGPEPMSRGRFIALSLLPSLAFGGVPMAVGAVSGFIPLMVFGALCLSMGAGDLINVRNALVQVPRGARVYMHGFHSYWAMPKS